MRERVAGTSMMEYLLPAAIITGAVLVFAIGVAPGKARLLFKDAVAGAGTSTVFVQPLGTELGAGNYLEKFNFKNARNHMRKLVPTCVNHLNACVFSPAGGAETAGGLGAGVTLAQQVGLILASMEDKITSNPSLSPLKKKFRLLADEVFLLSKAQEQLAQAFAQNNQEAITQLIHKINGGSLTYRETVDETTRYTVVSGNQDGSLIAHLRLRKIQLTDDPLLAQIPEAEEVLNSVLTIVEYKGLGNAGIVEGPPPATLQGTVSIIETVSDPNISLSNATAGDKQVITSSQISGYYETNTNGSNNTSIANSALYDMVATVNTDAQESGKTGKASCAVGMGEVSKGNGDGGADKCLDKDD